jgi:hypothetical protein
MDPVSVDRRRFLAAAAGIVILAMAPRAWASRLLAGGRDASRPSAGGRLVALFHHRRSARFIGREYLAQRPEEAGEELLVGLVTRGLGGGAEEDLRSASQERLRRLLQARTRQDFAEGRIVRLEGWMISITEARLCALATVIEEGGRGEPAVLPPLA